MMKQLQRAALTGLLAALVVVTLPARSEAVPFGFTCLTNNNAGNCSAGESQLSMNVIEPYGPLTATFEFLNIGSSPMSITDIYFDEFPPGSGDILSWPLYPVAFESSTGVNFTYGANPGNLPGGNTASPQFVASDSFDSASGSPGVMANGVNPGEWLRINFILATTFDNLIDQLVAGALRVGVHVQGFGNGGSESFLASPNAPTDPAPVPEPATLLLLGSGLAGAAGYARRRRAASKV